MSEYIYKTPDGMKDYLLSESITSEKIKQNLSFLFKRAGYNEVVTPALEYFDLFNLSSSGMAQEEMYKLSDTNGRLLVLRPDTTMPIARLASTRLKDYPLPLRLFYCQKVFRINQNYKGRRNEILQAGTELIGQKGIMADIEIIMLAARSFEDCGITDYTIEIGHAGIFKKLAQKLKCDSNAKEKIRVYIEQKNYSALREILEKEENKDVANAILSLPKMFGDKKILDSASKVFGEIAVNELNYLGELYAKTYELLGDKIRLDLGLVHRNNYYSGVVFCGYTKGLGYNVISGGRYDNLFKEFSKDIPAVGFAVDVDMLTSLICEDNLQINGVDILVFAKLGFEISAYKYYEKLMKDGIRAEIYSFNTYDEAEKLKLSRKAKEAVIVDNDKQESI